MKDHENRQHGHSQKVLGGLQETVGRDTEREKTLYRSPLLRRRESSGVHAGQVQLRALSFRHEA